MQLSHTFIHYITSPDSKIHGANMGPTWVLSAPGVPHVGPMDLAIRGNICFPQPPSWSCTWNPPVLLPSVAKMWRPWSCNTPTRTDASFPASPLSSRALGWDTSGKMSCLSCWVAVIVDQYTWDDWITMSMWQWRSSGMDFFLPRVSSWRPPRVATWTAQVSAPTRMVSLVSDLPVATVAWPLCSST